MIQFERTYTGNFKFSFPLILSGCNDAKTLNYSNFYLSNDLLLSDVISREEERIKSTNFQTTLRFGESYLQFVEIDPTPYSNSNRVNEVDNYGACSFGTLSSKFRIEIKDNNFCHVIHSKNYIDFYLASDESNELFFVKEKLLNFSPTSINSQDFRYAFSEDRKFIFLFQNKADKTYQLTKNGNNLVMIAVTSGNVDSTIGNYFTIERNLYSDPFPNLNTSFITYNNQNNHVDDSRSVFDLKNNILIHRPYVSNTVDFIVLKNQLPQNDVFSCGNNLLSSGMAIGSMRNYTSIFEDIKQERSEDLELNYVFYNKFYKIVPGRNTFVAPSSMNPFNSLNINDTKFIDCGSFSFSSPELADKVYKQDTQSNNIKNDQQYLCTWLSGGPVSTNKVWVDRYYYPDLITKEEALSANPQFDVTYDDVLEKLIKSNLDLKSSINITKFFDKKSDLIFSPNETFIYDRLNNDIILNKPEISKICNCIEMEDIPSTNYFRDINRTGKFTFGFFFIGDDSEWIVESNRNNINGGIRFIKTKNALVINLTLYDPSNGGYIEFEEIQSFKFLKENFAYISVDALNGKAYFYMNNNIIQSYSFPIAQYFGKNILFGDLFLIENNDIPNKKDILSYSSINIFDVILIKDYIDEDFAFYLQLSKNKFNIQDIQISLPCGMRNSTDKIDILNSVCSSSIFKSGTYDIKVKNLNTNNQDVLNTIETIIRTKDNTPLTSNLNTVEFLNFK